MARLNQFFVKILRRIFWEHRSVGVHQGAALLGCVVVLWAPAMSAVAAAPGEGGASVIALIGGRVIDGYGGAPLDDATVIIVGNTLREVGPSAAVAIPAGARSIDLHGMTVMPGLWEWNGHLSLLGEGVPAALDAERGPSRIGETLAAAARTSLMAGVTSYRDCGGPLEDQVALRRAIETGQRVGPRLLLAGPPLYQARAAKPDPHSGPEPYAIANATEAARVVHELKSKGVNLVFLNGLWDVDVLRALVTQAHHDGLLVDAAIRHVTELHVALAAGVDSLHHLFTADPLSDYSQADWQLILGGQGLPGGATAGPYIVPTIEMRNAYVRAFDYPGFRDDPRPKLTYAPDVYKTLRDSWSATRAIPWGTGARERVLVAFDKVHEFIVKGGADQLLAGTDAGSPLNMHSPLPREIRNLARAGLSPMQAIQSATFRAARAQGMLDTVGTVTAGKLADLLIVEGDPLDDLSVIEHRAALVIKDGVLYSPPHSPFSSQSIGH